MDNEYLKARSVPNTIQLAFASAKVFHNYELRITNYEFGRRSLNCNLHASPKHKTPLPRVGRGMDGHYACSASASGSSFLRPISTMAMMMNCTTPQSMVSRGVPVL